MRAVGIKELRNRLSSYLQLVRDGEVVLVTDRDRVVAEIRPPEPGRPATTLDTRLEAVRRKGWIRECGRFGAVPPPPPGILPLDQILEGLDGDRGDRFG